MSFCSNCGNQIKEGNKFCSSCGTSSSDDSNFSYDQSSAIAVDRGVYRTAENKFSHLSAYYQEQFSKISESGEVYTGKWNWAAFLFGAIWALSKGLWLPALIAIVGSMFTYGIVGLIYCILFAIRGNYMYYNLVAKQKQSIF